MKRIIIYKFKRDKLFNPDRLKIQLENVFSFVIDRYGKVETFSISMTGTDFVDEKLSLIIRFS